MSFEELKKECLIHRAVRKTEIGDECKVSGGMCNGKNCPSKAYWSKGHKQPGYYRQRALDRTGLAKQFEEDMAEDV